MPSVHPPHSVRIPMVRQTWRCVTFVHWPVAPSSLEAKIPEPLRLDTFDGAAWVSLTPFSTTCEIAGVAPVPGARRFPETNVRTYVRGPDGRDGLYFISLDVTNRANALLGRVLALPYFLSDMSLEDGSSVHYVGHRPDPDEAGYDVAAVPEAPRSPDALDVFLTGRWSAYVACGCAIVRYDVEHEPWPLHDVSVLRCDQTLLGAAGIEARDPDRAHFSPGVTARLAPARLSATRRSSTRT